MGITGLLPYVKNACRPGNIRELSRKSVAVDVSCFLHKGLTGCMDKIHMGEDTESYLYYVEKFIKELLNLECHVVLVFDGRPLPAKKETNDSRRETRDANIQHAEILLAKGLEKEARDKFRIATKISPEIVENAIKFFRNRQNIDIVVAPYEADAQLAYLMRSNLVDAVITEDSDLIVFECEKIYFKWQAGSGECTVYERSNLKKCFTGEMSGDKFDFVKFRRICILSGCDYIPAGLPGVGLSKATNFFQRTSLSDLQVLLKKIPSYLNAPKLKPLITSEFIESFEKAEKTFKHQIVFDPKERTQKPLTAYPEAVSDDEYKFAGTICSQRKAIRLALGNKENESSLNDEFLLSDKIDSWSVWSDKYSSRGTILEKEKHEKSLKATECCAFKLDAPSAKRQKSDSQKSKRKFNFENDEDDDIVKQFMEDVEKSEKLAPVKKMRKSLNSSGSDYTAEMLMKKYATKRENEIDDFDEIFEAKKKRRKVEEMSDSQSSLANSQKKEEISDSQSSVTRKTLEGFKLIEEEIEEDNDIIECEPESSKKEPPPVRETKSSPIKSQTVKSLETEKQSSPNELRPPPVLRKTVSTPSTISKIKKFQSPILPNSENQTSSQPTSTGSGKKILGQSKYFAKNSDSPRISNPFRCPAFIKPSPTPTTSTEQNSTSNSNESSDNSTTKYTSSSPFSFVGFKNTGLRRKK